MQPFHVATAEPEEDSAMSGVWIISKRATKDIKQPRKEKQFLKDPKCPVSGQRTL